MFNTGNPALNENTFDQFGRGYSPDGGLTQVQPDTMTMAGTVWKTMLLLMATVAAATVTWNMTVSGTGNPAVWAIGGVLVGLVLSFVISFKPTLAPFLAPIYAIAEGLALGAISAVFETMYGAGTVAGMPLNGLVAQAIGLTFGTAVAMLILYTTGIIRVTEKMRAVVSVAIGGAMLFYLFSLGAWFLFGVDLDPVANASPLSIGISVLMLVIASFKLLLDFDMIERGANAGAPKYMEWYGGFALLVSLVWLYIEFLKLLAKLQNRD